MGAAGPPAAAAHAAAAAPPPEIRVLEVDAYASVQDLIHAAILSNKGAASLKEVGRDAACCVCRCTLHRWTACGVHV